MTGVAVMVVEFPVVEPCVTVSGEPLNVKDGGPATVSANVPVRVSDPETPVMVSVTGPVMEAELAAVSVIVLVLVAGLGEMLAVTPAGSPDAESVTELAKPPDAAIWMVPAVL